ncbi:MAG: ATP-binding protein [Caulobacteraceae bacterium]
MNDKEKPVFTVYTCIRDQHDLRLVALAALICVVSAVTAFRLQARAIESQPPARHAWMVLTGVVAGSGVWATHFISMVAYHPGLPIHYDLAGTVLSAVPALLGMGAGFALAATRRDLAASLAGGAVAGMSIATMHYLGISSVRAAMIMQWDGRFAAAAIAAGAICGMAAMAAARQTKGVRAWLLPPALLMAGIVALHFTSMAAVSLIPDPSAAPEVVTMGRNMIAGIAAAIAGLILAAALALFWVERQTRRASLRSVSLAFQAVPSGLALYDDASRLVLWNSAYEQLIGDYGMVLSPGIRRLEVMKGIVRARWEGVKDDAEMEAMSRRADDLLLQGPREWPQPDGRWLRIELCPSTAGGHVSVMTDVTSLKLATDAMADARDKAEAASRAKSEFLANMSHEIRTPLNGVLGMAQVMEADALSEAQRDRLKVIRESGGVLLAILNDVLDLSKIQAGKMELAPVDFDAGALAGAVRDAFAGSAAAKDIDLVCEISDAAKGYWVGDALRIRQVLANLVSNAIKFSADAPVTVGMDVEDGSLKLTVRDRGIGIAADKIGHLFAAFSQADASMTRRYGGTGLGLSISRDLAELMGGDIKVESAEGAGSVFTVRLPLPRAAQRPQAEAAADGPSVDHAQPLSVLAAEDNITNQLVLRALLQPFGVRLTIVPDGAQAVEAFKAGAYDAILMDVQMPIMNGIDATQAIRALEASEGRPRTPILALSANVMTHQVAEYIQAGMDGAVAKPIDMKLLLTALDEAVSRAPEARAA